MKRAHLDEHEIRYRVSQIRDLPALSPGLPRIMEIMAKEMSSPQELESLLLYDPGLAARVIRTANSALYGCRGEVISLSHAINLLGYEQVKSACLCALLSDEFSGREPISPAERERLWKHAFVTARIASMMTTKRPWVSRETAWLLGLLHDIGRVIVAVYFSEEYELIQKLAHKRKVPLWGVESQFGLSHTLIGKWIAIRWAFPLMLQDVIEFHHEPRKSQSFGPETKLVALSNLLANSTDYPEYLDDDLTRMYCNDLCISEAEWGTYRGRLAEILAEADQFWDLLKQEKIG